MFLCNVLCQMFCSCLTDFSYSYFLCIWNPQVVCHDHGATPGSPQGGHPGVGHSHPQGRPAGASPTACSQAGALLQVCLLPAWSHIYRMIVLNAWNQSNQACHMCCWLCSGLLKPSYHWTGQMTDCARSCVQHADNHALKKQMRMAT